jgi:hypothetical protein
MRLFQGYGGQARGEKAGLLRAMSAVISLTLLSDGARKKNIVIRQRNLE